MKKSHIEELQTIFGIQDNLLQHQRHEKVRFVVEMLADSLRAAGTI